MKVKIYALYEIDLDEIYVGMTKDLSKRLVEHKRGKTKYTKKFKNFVLIYTEEAESYEQGRVREKFLKNASGKEFLRRQLESLKNAGIV